MIAMQRTAYAIFVATLIAFGTHASAAEPTPASVFEQRIMPIFNSPNPSSCVQCHLSSVDLKDYIRPSSRETFLSLRDQGLVDVDRPSESKILHLIEMGDSDSDSLAKRIHAKNRAAEYEAFASWIAACCQDSELVNAAAIQPSIAAGPKTPVEVIRHTRKDRVLDSFVRNIWSQRMRCFPCHTPAEIDAENPMHAKPLERHKEFVAKFGAKMNIFKETPEQTLQSLIASSRKRHGNDLPLINVDAPLQSLLLLKPTAKVPAKDANGNLGKPSSVAPVSHLGGIKMHTDDQSYKAFAAWLQDYALAATGGYRDGKAIPKDNWYPTEHVIRIKGLPADWPNLSTVQIFVHRWDSERDDWSPTPIAFTQCKVTPRKMVNGSLFVIATDDQRDDLSPEGETIPAGRVQLRLYLDRDEVLRDQPTKLIHRDVPDASAVIDAKFEKGFKNADVVEGEHVRMPGV
tara:strand:+ start:254 stop:1630 length:1377 start_codon:yes stop_codon:yes gene_type:complete